MELNQQTILEILHDAERRWPRVHEIHYVLPDDVGKAVISFLVASDVTDEQTKALADKMLEKSADWKFNRHNHYKLR